MGESKIDITSTVVEKGVDTAKSFIDKLIMPAIEEVGLLIKGKVTEWRFNQEVRMINKARKVCEVNNIKPKNISLKLLSPILEYSGLEEDELLHDKWAVLLSNMVDSEQNIANHVFPYILSQLSKNEFFNLEQVYDKKLERVKTLLIEKDEYRNAMPKLIEPFQEEINGIDYKILELEKKTNEDISFRKWELQYERTEVYNNIISIKNKFVMFDYDCRSLEIVSEEILENFEFSNVIRLGLVKEDKDFYAGSQTLEIPTDKTYYQSHINVDFDIDVESDVKYYLTELGELFFSACKEKQYKN